MARTAETNTNLGPDHGGTMTCGGPLGPRKAVVNRAIVSKGYAQDIGSSLFHVGDYMFIVGN